MRKGGAAGDLAGLSLRQIINSYFKYNPVFKVSC